MKKAIVLAIALAMPVAAVADEKPAKMDVAKIEKTVRVSSQGTQGPGLAVVVMSAVLFIGAVTTSPLGIP